MGPKTRQEEPRYLPPMNRDLKAAVQRMLGQATIPRAGNAALVWHRYPLVWTSEPVPKPVKSEHRAHFLTAFVSDHASQAPVHGPALRARCARMDRIADQRRDYLTEGRLVTGLGADHPVENGFSFEPLLGVPILAGSTVKGMCRAGATLVGADNEEVEPLLGSLHPDHPEAEDESDLKAGSIVFLGALPTRWPTLDIDILNPHHPEYYKNQGESYIKRTRLAIQTEEPKPVCFLTVGAGVPFRFWLHWRGQTAPTPLQWESVWVWLSVGLAALGVGGKTAAGYGRMVATR